MLPGVAHHITHRGNNRQTAFFDNDDYGRYLALLHKYSRSQEVRILAYCLMPNHIHLVGVPKRAESLAGLMKRLQGEHTALINESQRRCGHLWHGRFYSCPMDLDHTVCALGYVELNPVRAGMLKYAWEYPWSSAAPHCGVREDRLLNLEKWFRNYDADEWQDISRSAAIRRGFVEEIREHTTSGKPFGDRAYFKKYGWA